MNKLFFAQKRFERIYNKKRDNLCSDRFFQDLNNFISFYFGDYNERKKLFYFEPSGCVAEELFRKKYYQNLSFEIEQNIVQVTNYLLRYGRAYLYLQPEYIKTADNNSYTDDISAIEMMFYVGCIISKNGPKTYFYTKSKGFEGEKKELVSDRLIEFNLKDIGFGNNYFKKIGNRLCKYDTTSSATKFLSEQIEGYDFIMHKKYNEIESLKITKKTGWYINTEELSNSYIMFRRIQMNKLKKKILDYIVEEINKGIIKLLGDQSAGTLRINVKDLDYDKMWNDYLKGEMTGSNLNKVLFRNY
ncbi:MAG: hypothetical protein IJM24_03970 [Clostridia bacterium]|nr:hypothetical protein [Clostridia bacterium]